MGLPSRFQLALVDPALEQGDNASALYQNPIFTRSTSGGGVTPTGIAASSRGAPFTALRIGAQPTSGSPLSQYLLDMPAPAARMVVTIEVYLDYDDSATGSNGGDFLNWFRILSEGSSAICELGQLSGAESSTKTILSGEAQWDDGRWSSNHVAAQTPTRLKIDVTESTGTVGGGAGHDDGVIRVYVEVSGEWVLVSERAHDRGKPQRVRMLNRPLNAIQAEEPEVEFRMLSVHMTDPPVVYRPSSLSEGSDVWIAELDPNGNFSAGTAVSVGLFGADAHIIHAMDLFDLQPIRGDAIDSGTEITSARIEYWRTSSGDPVPVTIDRLHPDDLAAYEPSEASWSNAASGTPWPTQAGASPDSNTSALQVSHTIAADAGRGSVDVTGLVQHAQDNDGVLALLWRGDNATASASIGSSRNSTPSQRLTLVIEDGSGGESVFDFSDLQQCAQLRGVANSATSGKWDQAVFVSYDPRVYGTPTGAIQAEVQASTDPSFASGVIHASIALVDASTYVGAALTDSVDFAGVARLKALDPLSTYHWRVRLVDGGTISDPDSAITGGAQVLLTDSASFATMSAPGGAAGSLKLMHGTCQRHDDLSTPHNHWLRAIEFGPHVVLVSDDHWYGDLSWNNIAAVQTFTAGAPRMDAAMLTARGAVFAPQPWTRLATIAAVMGAGSGNHPMADSQFPGNTTPTDINLVNDVRPAFRRYWEDGTLLQQSVAEEGRWGHVDFAATRLFFANSTTYHNDGGAHGPEGRALQANPPRLLGATQMQALLDAIAECEAPMFLIEGMPSFANDAESPSSVGVGWALAPDQRQDVIDAIEANTNIRLFMTFCGHWHFSCVTRQGLPTDGKHLADVIAAPLARPIGANFDTAFLAGYDGGPIFKSDNGATVGGTDPTSMFALIEVDESALSVRVRIQNDAGADLFDQTFHPAAPRRHGSLATQYMIAEEVF